VVNALKECESIPRRGDCAVVFFYCSFQEPSTGCLDIVASLVDQLLSVGGTLPNQAVDIFEEERRRPRRELCDVDTLSKILKALIKSFTRVYMLIDALDKFAEMGDLIDLIYRVHEWSLPQLHILLTSQSHDIRITDCMHRMIAPQYRIDLSRSGIHEDFRLYIRESLRRTPEFWHRWGSSEILSKAEDVLVGEADGSYVNVSDAYKTNFHRFIQFPVGRLPTRRASSLPNYRGDQRSAAVIAKNPG
jgi:hypothetical protein